MIATLGEPVSSYLCLLRGQLELARRFAVLSANDHLSRERRGEPAPADDVARAGHDLLVAIDAVEEFERDNGIEVVVREGMTDEEPS